MPHSPPWPRFNSFRAAFQLPIVCGSLANPVQTRAAIGVAIRVTTPLRSPVTRTAKPLGTKVFGGATRPPPTTGPANGDASASRPQSVFHILKIPLRFNGRRSSPVALTVAFSAHAPNDTRNTSGVYRKLMQRSVVIWFPVDNLSKLWPSFQGTTQLWQIIARVLRSNRILFDPAESSLIPGRDHRRATAVGFAVSAASACCASAGRSWNGGLRTCWKPAGCVGCINLDVHQDVDWSGVSD